MHALPLLRRPAICAALVLLPIAMSAAADGPPVMKPHDLLVGRTTYTQNGQNVRQVQVGVTVAIACNYVVNAVDSPFVFAIQPWQGQIQVGGPAAQTFPFQGDPRGGQHEARLLWTPRAVGHTPISCVLNQGYEDSEAYANNNRWNETIDVVGDGDAPPPAGNPAPAPVDNGDRHPPGIKALAERGIVLTNGDPKAASLRDQMLYGFNIGMGGTEEHTLWGPGQQARLDSLTPAEQVGYKVASTYSLERNRKAEQAAAGGVADSTSDAAPVRAKPASCGDFVTGAGEQCDDGNIYNGDGCSATCQSEQ